VDHEGGKRFCASDALGRSALSDPYLSSLGNERTRLIHCTDSEPGSDRVDIELRKEIGADLQQNSRVGRYIQQNVD